MAIKYSFKVDHEILMVKASGKDGSLEEAQDYAKAIIDAAIKSNCTKVLCDESELVYTLSASETYELAQTTAFDAPKIARTAIITLPEYKEIVEFWETVALNRGLLIRVFFNIESAKKWLTE